MIFLAASRVADAGSKRAPHCSCSSSSSSSSSEDKTFRTWLLDTSVIVFTCQVGETDKISVVFIWALICQGKFIGFRRIDAEDFILLLIF